MAVSTSATVVDPDHLVSYVSGGSTVTTPRSLPLYVFAPDTPGTYPVIAYSHGHGGGPTQAVTTIALADLGYIVVAPAHLDGFFYAEGLRDQFPLQSPEASIHRAADMQFAIDQASALAALLPGGGYAADLSRIVVAGHSHGAHTAALLAGVQLVDPAYALPASNAYGIAATADPRIAAAILLSPQGLDSPWATLSSASWDALAVPVLGLTGTLDASSGSATWEARLDFMRFADAGPLYAAVLQNATHAQIGGGDPSPIVTATVASIADTFLDAYLTGDAAALAVIASPEGLVAAYPILQSAYERAGPSNGGTANGSGYAKGVAGVDLLYGLQTDDALFGEAGDDFLFGGAGADILNGGDGADTASYAGAAAPIFMNIGAPGSTWTGDAANDSLSGIETIVGTGFGDAIIGAGSMMLNGGGGGDLLYGDDAGSTFVGGPGDDGVIAAGGADTAFLGDGADYAYGGEGVDSVFGESGADILLGEAGADLLYGGEGQDYLFGLADDDSLSGDAGVDILIGDAGNDIITGGDDGDYIYGGGGADAAAGGNGADLFVMEGGADYVFGGSGNDFAYGGDDNDILEGGADTDILLGENGDDYLNPGAGVDYVFMGTGTDVLFMDALSSGVAVLYDFTPGLASLDFIRILNSAFTTTAEVRAAMTDTGNGYSILTIDADTAIWLIGVTPGQLAAGDVIFA